MHSTARGPGCGTLLCVRALSPAGSLSPRRDVQPMDYVPLCLLKATQQVSQQGKYEQMGNLASSEFQEECKVTCAF